MKQEFCKNAILAAAGSAGRRTWRFRANSGSRRRPRLRLRHLRLRHSRRQSHAHESSHRPQARAHHQRRRRYDFEALTPGEYTLVFESGNFATYTVKQIVVTIGSSIALDAHMKVKTAEQSITVTAEAAGAIDTTTAGVTQLLDSRSLNNLPFPGRDYRDLAQLTPSAQVVPGLRGEHPPRGPAERLHTAS